MFLLLQVYNNSSATTVSRPKWPTSFCLKKVRSRAPGKILGGKVVSGPGKFQNLLCCAKVANLNLCFGHGNFEIHYVGPKLFGVENFKIHYVGPKWPN